MSGKFLLSFLLPQKTTGKLREHHLYFLILKPEANKCNILHDNYLERPTHSDLPWDKENVPSLPHLASCLTWDS